MRALGEVGSKEGELESLLEEWEVSYRPFSKGILECLPVEGESWVVPSKEDDPKKVWAGREDFREMIICSIDPPGTPFFRVRLLKSMQLTSGSQAARILTMPCTLGVCQTATLKQAFVSQSSSFLISRSSLFVHRHRRRLPLCSPRQRDGRRSCVARNDRLPRRQTCRHAASSSRHEPLQSATFR